MTASLATLVVGGLALLGVIINVASAHFIRRGERREKQEDWLKEKQVRDVEEIVQTLDNFLADITPQVERLDACVSRSSKNLEDLPDVMESGYVELNSGVTDALQDAFHKYEEIAEVLRELDRERRSWFNFNAKRLSIWFEDSNAIEKQLEKLGEKIYVMNTALLLKSKPLMEIVRETIEHHGVMNYPTLERVRELEQQFKPAVNRWQDVRNSFLGFQKELADRYKSGATKNEGQLNNDRLLVYLARKLEAGVLWFFR